MAFTKASENHNNFNICCKFHIKTKPKTYLIDVAWSKKSLVLLFHQKTGEIRPKLHSFPTTSRKLKIMTGVTSFTRTTILGV